MTVAGSFTLAGQVAVVTGAGGNLGPVWIGALLEAGASVAGIDRPNVDLQPFLGDLQRTWGDRLRVYRADVRDRDALVAARDACIAEMGSPTVLVNNAGIDQPPDPNVARFTINQIPADLARAVFDVNVHGAFQVAQVFGEAMLRQGAGSIINICSLYSEVSPDAHFYDHMPGEPPFVKPPSYGASKAALLNLTKYLATHWAPLGVRVNALSPGGVEGGQDPDFKAKFCARVPMGRMAEFDDLRGPLLFLASNASSYVTGINLMVDGGFTAW